MTSIIGRIITLLFFSLFFVISSVANAVEVQEVTDLQALSAKMKQEKLVMVLEFHGEDCTYCEQLEDEILKPMLISGDYNDLVLIKKIASDSYTDIPGFDGKPISGSALAAKMDVFVTPTLVFLDANGKEVSERLVGINTPELFGAYVDAAIEEGRQTLPMQ